MKINRKTKIKITALILLLILSFQTIVIAAPDEVTFHERTGEDSSIADVAKVLTSDTELYLEEKYNATSIGVKFDGVKVYEYNQEKEQICLGDATNAETYRENEYYYTTKKNIRNGNEDFDILLYTIKLGSGNQKINNIATFLYNEAIEISGKRYDIKMNLKEIRKIGDDDQVVQIQLGKRTASESSDLYDTSTYTSETVYPQIGVPTPNNTNQLEISVEYYILDHDTHEEIEASGLLNITDLDLNQGVYIKGENISNEKTYISETMSNGFDGQRCTVKYINEENDAGTYVYNSNEHDTTGESLYQLIDSKNKLEMDFFFDRSAYSSIVFRKLDNMKYYKKIETEVVGGTISENIYNIQDGENKTIEYAPTNDTKYLKSIEIDGTEIEITPDAMNQYTFSNITENHKIKVVYEDKYIVTYDANGGTPTPNTEYVLPNNKATEPTTDPIKTGYTFEGWRKERETELFDYNTEITEDIDLEAKWTPIEYNITYVLNGGTNDDDNPSKYTIEDTIDFQPATREGYDFIGWYEDENLTDRKDGISHETGDKTVYAKWEAKKNIPYRVEHYKETTDGKYELVVTDDLTGENNALVTAVPKEYTGFVENKTHENRIEKGTILPDGSLVLKLYYDKIKYKVTFDPQNNKKIDDQIVKYQDKAVEPEKQIKDGYDFQYWYYINKDGKEVQYNFDDPVTENIDLIAKWKAKTPVKIEVEPKTETKIETETKPSVLPYTGNIQLIIIISILFIVVTGIIVGKKYFRLNKIIK